MKEELENGEHTIYLATVNNSGKIIARSAGFLFTKTAEAVTLGSLSPANDSANIVRPGLFSGSNIYFLIVFIAVMLALFFVLIGVISKKTPQ